MKAFWNSFDVIYVKIQIETHETSIAKTTGQNTATATLIDTYLWRKEHKLLSVRLTAQAKLALRKQLVSIGMKLSKSKRRKTHEQQQEVTSK